MGSIAFGWGWMWSDGVGCGRILICYSLKKLFPVKFSLLAPTNASSSSQLCATCPACLRPLNNSMPLSVLKKCGHLLCTPCISKFVSESLKCFSCERPCKPKDIINIRSEGTGFSKKGKILAEKQGVAFL